MRQRLRYEFDNLMTRGLAAQIAVLGGLTAGLVGFGGLLLFLAGLGPADQEPNLARVAWLSLMRAMDAGAVGGDQGPWSYLFVNLAVTVGGIFVFSTLIGVLNNSIGAVLEELRKGRSFVVEHDHVIVLGYTTKIARVLTQLAENPRLMPIFDDLLSPEGYEIYLRPVEAYVSAGVPVDFYTVTASAAARGHVAIGHRIAAFAADVERAYGVTLNPRKSVTTTYGPGDRIVVLAADV
jgi:hypothetical protein